MFELVLLCPEDRVEVLSGLRADDKVATDPQAAAQR